MKNGFRILCACAVFIALVSGIQVQKCTGGEGNKRIGSLIKVRPDYEERYIIIHKHTFPGVLAQIRKSNIRNYSIFLRDGVLFSHFEYIGEDFNGDMEAMGQDKTTREWWKLTEPMQEPLATRKEGEWWASTDEVFHLDEKTKPYQDVQRFAFLLEIGNGLEDAAIKQVSAIPVPVIEQLKKINVQNLTVYYKDSKLYLYLEYFGNNLFDDAERLTADSDVRSWWGPFQSKLKTEQSVGAGGLWLPLEEVFHTD